jgi:small-conductance mechanosensitive channel
MERRSRRTVWERVQGDRGAGLDRSCSHFGFALVFAWAASLLIHRAALKALVRGDEFWLPLLTRTRRLFQLALTLLALAFAADLVALTGRGPRIFQHLLIIGFIACVTWVLKAALDIWMALHMKRYRIDVAANLLARKHLTQSRILQRVGTVLIVVVGFGAALMTIEGVRQYGVSLLASAGVAGIVVGLALQSVLRNLLAGIQIALTQPIRIDDAVIVEGEWGMSRRSPPHTSWSGSGTSAGSSCR